MPDVFIVASRISNPYKGFRTQLAQESWFQYVEDIQFAIVNPLSTADVRCSAVATAATKSTTSKSAAYDRFLAAEQLFTAIKAWQGGIGAKAAIAGSDPYLVDGKYVPTFQIYYIDGGKERWLVAPGISPTLIIDGNVGTPPQGDGIPKPCAQLPKG